jgi:rubrerythrin
MKTAHLVTSVDIEQIDTEEIYDEAQIESSINEVLGANSSLEESSEDWIHNVSARIEESVENYYRNAVNYINGETYSIEDEAEELARTLHSLDQSLELLSLGRGVKEKGYRDRLLEIKNRLEDEVIAPLTARALEKGDFTADIPDPEVDYLLRPVRDNYIEE